MRMMVSALLRVVAAISSRSEAESGSSLRRGVPWTVEVDQATCANVRWKMQGTKLGTREEEEIEGAIYTLGVTVFADNEGVDRRVSNLS